MKYSTFVELSERASRLGFENIAIALRKIVDGDGLDTVSLTYCVRIVDCIKTLKQGHEKVSPEFLATVGAELEAWLGHGYVTPMFGYSVSARLDAIGCGRERVIRHFDRIVSYTIGTSHITLKYDT